MYRAIYLDLQQNKPEYLKGQRQGQEKGNQISYLISKHICYPLFNESDDCGSVADLH